MAEGKGKHDIHLSPFSWYTGFNVKGEWLFITNKTGEEIVDEA